MYIEREKVRDYHRWVGDQIESGKADTVMVKSHGGGGKDDMHFCSGPDDWQEFMRTQPDAYAYDAIDTRALYELLISIDKRRIQAREVVVPDEHIKNLIDISSMLEDREIIRDLHAIMPKINVDLQSPAETTTEKGRILIEGIINNLQKLCKDDYGLSTANQLWDLYMSDSAIKKPDLSILPGEHWFADSLRQFESILELRIPALFDRTVKDLAKGDSSRIHLNVKDGSMPVVIYAEPLNRTLMAYLKGSVAQDNKISVSPDSKDRAIPLDQFIKIVSNHEDLTRGPKRPRGDSGDDPNENNLSRGRTR